MQNKSPRRDSNPRATDQKSVAYPLGHAGTAHGGGRTRIVPLRKGARYPIAPRERSHGRTRTAVLLVRNQTLSSPELHGRCTVGMGAMVA